MVAIYSHLPSLCPSQQASKGKVTSSGTYIPPKTGSHAVPEKASRPVENSHIATAGLFVPPSTTDGTEPLKGLLKPRRIGKYLISCLCVVCVSY